MFTFVNPTPEAVTNKADHPAVNETKKNSSEKRCPGAYQNFPAAFYAQLDDFSGN